MKRHTVLRRTALLTAALGLALGGAPAAAAAPGTVAAAANDPITVDLTVQGPNGAIFDGPITTTGHDVTTASGGTHPCDGTNNDMNPEPGATPTAALDDAADQENFTWDGTWYPSFDDYFVNTIDGHNGGSAAYWNISVHGTSTPVGGCQFRIEPGDDVAFTWTEM